MPVAVERVIRAGGAWKLVLHLIVAGATLGLVALSAFSGDLGRPPLTDASYVRFRVLHMVLLPFLGTLSLLAWRTVAGRYQVGTSTTGAKPAAA